MNLSKNIYRFLVSIFVFGLIGCTSSGPTSKYQIGDPAPYTRFTTIDGKYLAMDEFKGKTVVVFFWAAWCNYSRPALVRVNNFLKKRTDRNEIEVLAVSIDKSSNQQQLLDAIKYQELDTVTNCYSGNDVYDEAFMAFDADTLPHIFIIDKAGRIAAEGHKDSVVYEYFEKNTPR
jgi:peroxiredoxin